MSLRLGQLIDGLEGEALQFADMEIRGVVSDSRKVLPDYLFVAVPGASEDGHAYVEHAVHRGCAAVVTEQDVPPGVKIPVFKVPRARAILGELAARMHGHPTRSLNVVGITGTNGKSTTSYLLRSILEASEEKVGLLGTIQYVVGARILPAQVTTPGAGELQSYFSEMVLSGCKSAVMEVSSHALHQERVCGVRFGVGVFTNLQRDHMDYHGSVEAYRDAKAKLFEMLPERGVAVLNDDDPVGAEFARRTRARVVRFGLEGSAEVSGVVEACTLNGTRFRLRLGGEEMLIQSRLVGRHNVMNMMAAAASAWAMGYDLENIKLGLENVYCVPGRLDPVEAGQDFTVLVDYAHTADALENVLSSLKTVVRGRLITVFGCGGDRDRGKRPLMGSVAEDLSDLAIVTSDNPRSENPLDIIREVVDGMKSGSGYLVEPDRRAAIKLAISLARPGDAILIAGKGHESVQIFQDGIRPFDDRRVAREILTETVKHR